MVFGCTAVAAFSGKGQVLKAVLMTLVGLMLATVGEDPSGAQRLTFGNPNLSDGISFLLLSMATFALAEALTVVLKGKAKSGASDSSQLAKVSFDSLKISRDEAKEIAARSADLGAGFLCWLLPGAVPRLPAFSAIGWNATLRQRNGKNSLAKAVILDWRLLKPRIMRHRPVRSCRS